MGLIPVFDQTKSNDLTFYGEAVRLSNELRSKPAQTFINNRGERIDTPTKSGFDIETCDIQDIKNWINNTSIKKSQSLIMFVYRVLSVRFPIEFSNQKTIIDIKFREELNLIESESNNDPSWLGKVGFQNCVRLDGSLTDNSVKLLKLKNDEIMIKRI